MSVWDQYKVNELPEEQRAEVVKAIAKELEETTRAKINNSNHQTVRGMAVVGAVIVAIAFGLFGYWSMQEWKEVKLHSMTPMVCPPPPVCNPQVPAFDIKVVPSTPAASSSTK